MSALSRGEALIKKLQLVVGEAQTSGINHKELQALNSHAQRLVSEARSALRELTCAAEEKDSEREKNILLAKASHASRDLDRARHDLRKAVLEQHRMEEQIMSKQMATVLEAGKSSSRQRGSSAGAARPGSRARAEEEASKEITNSLSRTRQMMAQQMEKVSSVAMVVDEQQGLLEGTFEEHRGIDGNVKHAKRTLTRIKANDLLDTALMIGSTLLFFLAVLFVVWQRAPTFGLF